MDIPAQPGLSFEVHLNLQNRDELHLVASAFWCEWFPCSNPKKVERYIEAVSGLLVPRCQGLCGKDPLKLQVPRGDIRPKSTCPVIRLIGSWGRCLAR